MRKGNIYLPFIVAALLLCIATGLMYPFCQYYTDPDATSYLTISKRYAAGDWQRAVNGYWSPWSCWLTAILIKAGMQPPPSAIMVNTSGALGCLLISFSFFRLVSLRPFLQWLQGLSLALFLSYAVYKQTFADLWEVFFLLTVLRLMLYDRFAYRPGLWVLAGITGALAYFAKAYAFPFFILNILICSYIICRTKNAGRSRWLLISIVSIVTMIIVSSPWIYLLHNKYGFWSTGTAGKLNMSWYLVGHPHWKRGGNGLLPPVYNNSVYYWEDPFWANGATPQFWSSPHLFALQILKAGYNILKLVSSMNELSAFMLLIYLIAVAIIVSERIQYFFSSKTIVIAFSFLIFPLGFILINYEARYIWYLLPLSMVIGGQVLERILLVADKQKVLGRLYAVMFAVSFIVWPLIDIRTMWHEGEQDNRIAQQLRRNNIVGSFTARGKFGDGSVPSLARIAYFSGNPYYHVPQDISDQQLAEEIKRYHIRYYIHLPGRGLVPPAFNMPADTIAGIIVYRLQAP